MSDALKHECGIAMVRLLKPLQFLIQGIKDTKLLVYALTKSNNNSLLVLKIVSL